MSLTLLANIGTLSKKVDELLPEGNVELKPNGGKLKQRKVSHWAETAQWVVSVAGIIVCVVGIILGQYIYISTGALLAIQSSVAAYYLRDLKYLSTVDEYIKILGIKVELVASQIASLKILNFNLQQNVENISKETLGYQKVAEKANKDLNHRINEFDQMQKKLSQREKEIEDLKEQLIPLYTQIDSATNKMQLEVASFSKEHQVMEETVSKFSQETKTLNQETNFRNSKLEELTKTTQELTVSIGDITAKVAQLHSFIEIQSSMHREFSQFNLNIDEELKKINESENKAKKNTVSLVKSTQELEETAQRIKESTQNLKPLEELLPLKAILEEFVQQMKLRPNEPAGEILKSLKREIHGTY